MKPSWRKPAGMLAILASSQLWQFWLEFFGGNSPASSASAGNGHIVCGIV
jgi:hypothetical protein